MYRAHSSATIHVGRRATLPGFEFVRWGADRQEFGICAVGFEQESTESTEGELEEGEARWLFSLFPPCSPVPNQSGSELGTWAISPHPPIFVVIGESWRYVCICMVIASRERCGSCVADRRWRWRSTFTRGGTVGLR